MCCDVQWYCLFDQNAFLVSVRYDTTVSSFLSDNYITETSLDV